ncbi:class I SAM-dependent methyltransferase [Plantibacter sp. MMLR14_011]|uniref:class I SAM-dependent methyltransferase n=1 Tax=Plantibacter sp. MMLR14_011 TaxID=1898746 RepID=UPI0008DE08F3|nr:class I SAM-dependent methyltransferase [Plantibacter sp. MMLR14_011]OII42965.1 SAM-dependent methyltransferase [Plantibacter sp. MMLR14_011]
MDRSELVELLTADGLRLLDSLPPYPTKDEAVRLVGRLRKEGHSPELVAAVLTQSRLRQKAVGKFGPFAGRMLFTEAGLEQATRLPVAALHAGRFARAGLTRVADLGSGIGADSMAMASLDLEVTAVDIDEVTAAIASYNLAPFPTATVRNAAADDVSLDDFDAVWFDPARRTAGHADTARLSSAADYTPSLDLVFGAATSLPTGVKLGPGFDRSLIPDDAEAQWVSVDGQLVEMALWFGPLARPDIRRSALLLADGVHHELHAEADADDAPVRELGDYVHEPDGSVIRARLIGDLAVRLEAGMLGQGIAYLTSDTATTSPFATTFRVLERLPMDEKVLKRTMRDRGIGVLEVKKRGVDVDPAAFRKRMALRGDGSATIILTRIAGKHSALLVERVTPAADA